MRSYVYGRYAEKYGVNLEEAELELRQYTNFSEFFTRKIKPR
jgi:phosphatidylserine decarboxylase